MKNMVINFFFFNDTATTEIYTLSLHDALPISMKLALIRLAVPSTETRVPMTPAPATSSRNVASSASVCGDVSRRRRSEEHTSELQSQSNLVCRLLLEKKKTRKPGHFKRLVI